MCQKNGKMQQDKAHGTEQCTVQLHSATYNGQMGYHATIWHATQCDYSAGNMHSQLQGVWRVTYTDVNRCSTSLFTNIMMEAFLNVFPAFWRFFVSTHPVGEKVGKYGWKMKFKHLQVKMNVPPLHLTPETTASGSQHPAIVLCGIPKTEARSHRRPHHEL